MKQTKFLPILILAFLFSLNGCQKDDSQDEVIDEVQVHQGGEATTYQLTTIEVEGYSLQEEYTILLDGQELTALRVSDTELAFAMPADLQAGVHLVQIPALDGHSVEYTVSPVQLPQGPTETMDSFFSDYKVAAGTLDPTGQDDALASLAQLELLYESLSPAEQQEMAEYFYANKELFESVLQDSGTGKLGKLVKFKESIALVGISVLTALAFPTPIGIVVAVVVAGVGVHKAIKTHDEFSGEQLKILDIAVGEIFSDMNKGSLAQKLEGGLEFEDGIGRELKSGASFRGLVAEDANAPTGALVDFFNSASEFNGMIDKLNTAINFVNDNLFLSDIPLIEKPSLPENRTASQVAMDQELFNNISGSVSGPRVSLTAFELTAGSGLKIGMKIDKPEEVEGDYVDATLNIAYSDEFNQGTTGIPVRIYKAGLIIEGELEFGEVPVGETVTKEISLVNTSSGDIHVNSIVVPEDFVLDWTSGTVPANGSQVVTVSFTPSHIKDYTGELAVTDDKGGNNVLAMSGTGTNPYFGNWTAISFENMPMNTYQVIDGDPQLCGEKSGEQAMERIDVTLDANQVRLYYKENWIDYHYSFDSDEMGQPICGTHVLTGTQHIPYSEDHTVAYSWDPGNPNKINLELALDGESISMVFSILENGNMELIMIFGDDDQNTAEMERV